MPCDASIMLSALTERARETRDPDALAKALVEAIKEAMPKVSWAGVYWLEGDHLVLGPYAGPPTPHDRIPVGRGVCGTAVAEDHDQVVTGPSRLRDLLGHAVYPLDTPDGGAAVLLDDQRHSLKTGSSTDISLNLDLSLNLLLEPAVGSPACWRPGLPAGPFRRRLPWTPAELFSPPEPVPRRG